MLAFFIAAVALAVYLPVMVGARGARPRLDAQLPLAIIGGVFFSIPLLGLPFLQGRLAFMWQYYLRSPTTMLWSALPYLLAGAVLGWLLAEQPRREEVAAS